MDAGDPLNLVFFERWADLEALQAHFLVPASTNFVREVRKLSSGGAPMTIYQAAEIPPPN